MGHLARLKWPIFLSVIGAGVTIWLVTSLLGSFADPGITLLVPGESPFAITKPGKYTLWSQVEASFEGQLMTFPTGLPPGVSIKITRKADGTVVPLRSQWPTTHRDSGGYIQVVIGTITFDAAGSYQIGTEGLQEKRALYLDRFDFGILFLKAGFAVLGSLLFVAGLVWAIMVFVSDRNTRPNQGDVANRAPL